MRLFYHYFLHPTWYGRKRPSNGGQYWLSHWPPSYVTRHKLLGFSVLPAKQESQAPSPEVLVLHEGVHEKDLRPRLMMAWRVITTGRI